MSRVPISSVYRHYRTCLFARMEQDQRCLRHTGSLDKSWMRFPIDLTKAHLHAAILRGSATIRVGTTIENDRAEIWFDSVLNDKSDIESQFSAPLVFDRMPDNKRKMVYLPLASSDVLDVCDWDRQHGWSINTLWDFRRALVPQLEAASIKWPAH